MFFVMHHKKGLTAKLIKDHLGSFCCQQFFKSFGLLNRHKEISVEVNRAKKPA